MLSHAVNWFNKVSLVVSATAYGHDVKCRAYELACDCVQLVAGSECTSHGPCKQFLEGGLVYTVSRYSRQWNAVARRNQAHSTVPTMAVFR